MMKLKKKWMRSNRAAAALPRAQSRGLSRAQSRGQALAEMVVGLIALAVVFLGIILVADLCQARAQAVLTARAEAGSVAMGGLLMGSPTFYGSTDAGERVHTEILSVTHDPIQYCYYAPGDYPYITENLAAPLVAPGVSLIGTFGFVMSEKTLYVTNNAFLRELQVGGSSTISVTQSASLPQMKEFP